MPTWMQKTFGGLSPQYFFRQLFFGGLITAFVISMTLRTPSTGIGIYFLVAINTVLYPYSRFVYESIVGFVMGQNVFYLNAIVMLIAKLFTMVLCWSFSIFIAPIGLAYLYFHHSRASAEG